MALFTINKKCFIVVVRLFWIMIGFQICVSHAQLTAQTQLTAQSQLNAQSQPAPERNERWYQVEMIIFSRSESNPQEEWPKDIKLSYPVNLVNLKSGASDQSGFALLPQNERQLNAQAATIARSGSYSLLFHQAWRQMIYSRNTNIIISGGKTFNGHHELEGSISLSVAQYLKIQTNLWLTQFAPLATAVQDAEGWPELPPVPNTFDESEKAADYVTKRIVKVAQQRTMRSNEVHYIDHPLLGLVIKITPYDMTGQ